MVEWITTINARGKVVVYNSDVSGAFNRVKVERLIAKLRAKGFHPRLVNLLESWLQTRRAQVLVGGMKSEVFALFNMIFQGTVFGSMLWNMFFEDSREPISKAGFKDIYFADDLNALKCAPKKVRNSTLLRHAHKCQEALHEWGEANNVKFDCSKENFSILSRVSPEGEGFKLLGLHFDTGLYMTECVIRLRDGANWKLRKLLRAQRFYDVPAMITQYKTRILGFVEYRTAGIYHCVDSLLHDIDHIQVRFLRQLGVTQEEALLDFHLAPLNARRDMGMLGFIHRTVLGVGPN